MRRGDIWTVAGINGTGWHESDINRWIADPVAWRPKNEFDFDD